MPGSVHQREEERRYTVLNSGDLLVHHSSSYHEFAQFYCTAQNTLSGELYQSNQARVFVTESRLSEQSRLIYPDRNFTKVTVDPGANFSVGCVGRGMPPPDIIWYKEEAGSLVRVEDSLRVRVRQEVLTLLTVSLADTGFYLCEVSNTLVKQTARYEVVVRAAVSVSLYPTVQRVRKGDNVTLNCSVRGRAILISWFRNGARLEKQARYRFSTDLSVVNLVNLHEEDGGLYQCFVATHEETVGATARLIIQDSAPEIISSFGSETFIPGQFLSLRCVGRGRPPPHFSWELDGFRIHADGRYRQSQYVTVLDDVESQLNLTHLTDRDGGHYSCRAENKAGAVLHTQHIRVFGPPYIRECGPVFGVEGREIRIQCPVSGYPIQSIQWHKGLTELGDGKYSQVFNNGTLLIYKGRKERDNGEYTCTASHLLSKYTRTININIIVAPKMLGFSFQSSVLEEGMRTAVTCQTVEGELPISFKWFRDGVRVGEVGTVSIQQATYSSTLFISKLDRSQSGNYTCTATNSAGEDTRTAELTVNVPPEWSREPDSRVAAVGDSLKIPCAAFGVPEPTVSWFKIEERGQTVIPTADQDGSLLVGQDGPLLVGQDGFLLVETVDGSSEGEYLCTVDNGVGRTLSKSIRLEVKSPASFDDGEVERRVVRGEAMEFLCLARGDPTIQYQWFKDSRRINPLEFSRYIVEETDVLGSLLRIGEVVLEDSGILRCEAFNSYGRDVLTLRLFVLDVPGVPLNLTIREISSRQGLVEWVPPDSSNSPILHYTLHSSLLSVGITSKKENEITVGGQSRSLILRSLLPGQEYSLSIRAHNSVGASNSSSSVYFNTLEQAPSGRAQVTSLSPKTSTSLELVWEAPAPSLWNSKLIGYTVGYRLQGSSAAFNQHNLALGDKHQFSHLIEGLAKYRRYEVVVSTWNYEGRGETTNPYFATTLQDVPSGSPENLLCESKSSRSLAFSWEPPALRERNGEITKFSYLYYSNSDPDERRRGEVTEPGLVLDNLELFTNYTFSVRAHTQAGVGPFSEQVVCTTLEDVPEAPAKVKVISNGDSSFYVSWIQPNQPKTGIRRYTVYWRKQSQGAEIQTVRTESTFVRLGPLSTKVWYDFWVRAETAVGQGPSSPISTILALNTGSAQIVSFGRTWRLPHTSTLLLDCLSVGFQNIRTHWLHNGAEVEPGGSVELLSNNSLRLNNLTRTHSGEYDCEVENREGADRVRYTVLVESPPPAPSLVLADLGTESALLVWTLVDQQSIPVLQYTLAYRNQLEDWLRIQIEPSRDSHRLTGLKCGSNYTAVVLAANRVGEGNPSSTILFQTEGTAPTIAASASLLLLRNRTLVLVLLDRFRAQGCPFLSFMIEYRPANSSTFILVPDTIHWDMKEFLLTGLQPYTTYLVRVMAVNSAGEVRVEQEIATLGEEGTALNVYKTSSSGLYLVLIFFVVMGFPGVLIGLGFLAYFAFRRRHSSNQVSGLSGGAHKTVYPPRRTNGVTGDLPPLPPLYGKPPLPPQCEKPPHAPLPYEPEDLYGEVCPYATVELLKKKEDMQGFSTMYHQGFVYGEKFKSLRCGADSGASFYSQINSMETFRLHGNILQEENVYSNALEQIEDEYPGYETEEEEEMKETPRPKRKTRSKSVSSGAISLATPNPTRLDPARLAGRPARVGASGQSSQSHAVVPAHFNMQNFDPFDFPPKRKGKTKSEFTETKFY